MTDREKKEKLKEEAAPPRASDSHRIFTHDTLLVFFFPFPLLPSFLFPSSSRVLLLSFSRPVISLSPQVAHPAVSEPVRAPNVVATYLSCARSPARSHSFTVSPLIEFCPFSCLSRANAAHIHIHNTWTTFLCSLDRTILYLFVCCLNYYPYSNLLSNNWTHISYHTLTIPYFNCALDPNSTLR